MSKTPNPTRPVIGYRVWKLRADTKLGSQIIDYAWSPEINRAACLPSWCSSEDAPKHRSPGERCHCGFNGYHEIEGAQRHSADFMFTDAAEAPVMGVFQAWGKVVVHNEGFRSEFARPVALLPLDVGNADRVRLLCEEFDLSFAMSPAELVACARRAGEPVSKDLRPGRGRQYAEEMAFVGACGVATVGIPLIAVGVPIAVCRWLRKKLVNS